jgi:L-alanine-DL-glutamate epimerase-like enolase superfamily enzyme
VKAEGFVAFKVKVAGSGGAAVDENLARCAAVRAALSRQ